MDTRTRHAPSYSVVNLSRAEAKMLINARAGFILLQRACSNPARRAIFTIVDFEKMLMIRCAHVDFCVYIYVAVVYKTQLRSREEEYICMYTRERRLCKQRL